MKLLLISVKSTVSRGGIAMWTEHYLSQCAAHGIDCTLVNTEAVGKRAVSGTAKRNMTDELVRLKRVFKDLHCALKRDIDVAHLNTSCGNFGLFRDYLIACRIKKKGIPLITHYHCDIPYWIHNGFSKKYLQKLAAISDRNLVLCENSSRYLQEQFGVPSVKVPNFIAKTAILDSQKEIAQTAQRVVFVGRVSEAKGAAEIYALAKRFPEMTFELVGEVSELVASWEKPENILLYGGMSPKQVQEHLDSADIYLFPSHSEGFSVALMEAMARGVPAIATDVGANADMLSNSCGIIVKKGDVDAMEQALKKLQDSSLRKEISCKSVEKVRTHYTADAVILLLKKQYG